MYEILFGEVFEKFCGFNVYRVFIQILEGFKREVQELVDFFEENGIEVIISGDINYGVCDLVDSEVKRFGCDVLIYFGYFYMQFYFEVFIIFVFVFVKVDVVLVFEKNFEEIRKFGKRIVFVMMVQYIYGFERVKEFLEKNGFEVLIGRGDFCVSWLGQVFGCNFSVVKVDVDGVFFIGVGYFYLIGVVMVVKKLMFVINFYLGDVIWMDMEVERFVRKCWVQIVKVMDVQRFGVIMSMKKGQFCLVEVKRVVKFFCEYGKYVRFLMMNYISYQVLEGFDFDVYVVVVCLRVLIDDYENWRKFVFILREVEIFFGLREDYEFDEIFGVERREDEFIGISLCY